MEVPSLENCIKSKRNMQKSVRIEQDEQDHIERQSGAPEMRKENGCSECAYAASFESQELDWVYSLPYMRTYHPSYEVLGGVPGIEEVEFSITHNRGCFGACNFCSIQFHQGRYITARSKEKHS